MTQASSARDRASHFDLVVFVLAILGCGFFALAPRVHLAPIQVKGEPLRPFSSNEPALAGSGFAKDAVFSVVATPPTVSGVELYGSAVQGDASTGVVHTRWYLPVERFDILLAGYPLQPGESIGLEIEDQKSELHEQPIVPADNPETWSIRRIVLKNFRDARRFRIAAEDLSTKPLGWIGFSEPFVMNQFKYLLVLKQLGLAILCAAGCMVAFLGPGFLLRAYGPRFRSPVWLPLPGLIGMCLLGLLAWKAPSSLTPQSIVRIPLLLGSFVFLLFLARRRLSSLTTPVERSVLMIVWLLIALAVGKSVYSEGPAGELYRGQISRTLEANGRGDSRISFHVVQLVGLRQNAYSELSERLFSPWNFSHRGVVAGLATSPIVLATQALVPGSPPHATWSVFDPQGFTAYRIAVIVMSSVSLLILFGLAQCFLPDDWAFLAFLVTALAPFTIHEIFFTWPKILAEAFVLLAAYLVKTRRYFAAGCAIGIGYLYHPSALLWSPAVLVTVFLLNGSRSAWFSRLKNSAASAMRLVAGLSVFLLGWALLNGKHFRQGSFLEYLSGAGGLPYSPANWLHSRLESLFNTTVPLYLFLFHRTDRDLISTDLIPNAWVQFVQQYWCSVPFACGCFFSLLVYMLLAVAAVKSTRWILLVWLPSLVTFVIYFGAPSTGLMREGMHAWFFGLLIFSVTIWRKHLRSSNAFWILAICALGARVFETLLLVLPLSAWRAGSIIQAIYAPSDICALVVLFLVPVGLGSYAVLYVNRMRIARTSESASAARPLPQSTNLP